MYHVLIVDDEPLMRTYLAKSIPQFDEQFDVCGTAADGQEAIEYLKAHIGKVDVIITDIKMPEVDGLTLAGYVSARFPEIVLIEHNVTDNQYSALRKIQVILHRQIPLSKL